MSKKEVDFLDGLSLHVQKSGFFGGRTFFQPIKALRKFFQQLNFKWLEKSVSPQRPLPFWICKPGMC